jgi:hypothetical protein
MVDGPAPSALRIGVAALGLLASAAVEQPVLLLADDLHSFDDESAQVLLLLARRLETVPAVLLVGAPTAGRPTGRWHTVAWRRPPRSWRRRRRSPPMPPTGRGGVPLPQRQALERALDAVSATLTTEDLTELVKRVEVDKEDPRRVAEEFLRDREV